MRDRRGFLGRLSATTVVGAIALALLPAGALASAPSFSTDGAQATGPTRAWVGGAGSANGPSTTLRIDYAQASELWCASSGKEGPLQQTPSKPFGSGDAIVSEITVPVTGLVPNTEYCAALVGENEDGTSTIDRQARFTTDAAAKPTIEGVSASWISSRRATLEAKIAANGQETTYEFWTVYANCQSPPGSGVCQSLTVQKLGEGHIAEDSSETVNVDARNLTPEYEYSYWVVAKNASGETHSENGKFRALPAPVVDSESVSGLSGQGTMLEAQIDSKGQAVDYQFQLVEEPSEYASELECLGVEVFCKESGSPPRVLKIGHLPAGNGATAVKLDLAQAGVTLTPDVTYHYRVLVAPAVRTEDTVQWDGPPVYGADQTFTVPARPGPVVTEVSAAESSATDATLQARVDTEGLSTIYQFELRINLCPYSECIAYNDIPLPSGLLLGSFSGQTVSLDLNSAGVSLAPGVYEYALSATSAAGHVESQWQTLVPAVLDPPMPVLPLQTGGGAPPGPGSGTQNASPSSPQSSSPTSGQGALKISIPAGQAAGKGHIKVKRSVKHPKRKHGKSSAATHARRKARHR